MSFMQPQIVRDHFQVIENTTEGTIICPTFACVFSNDDVPEEFGVDREDVTTVYGFGARLSAPGYLDCTEWSIFDTEKEAAEYLLEVYEDGLDASEIESLRKVTQ